MQRNNKPESMQEINEQLQPQTKKLGIYLDINTRPAEPSVVTYLLIDNPELGYSSLLPHIDADHIGRFARLCKAANGLFQPLLPISRAAHYVVVKPSVVEIKKILDALAPDALKLFLQRKVKNVLGQSGITYVNMTLLQLAYSAGDDDMCLKLEPYFKRAFGNKEAAREAIHRQLNEKFAEGSEAEKAQREIRETEIKTQLQGLLKTVIQAISDEKFNLGCDANNKLILSPATLAAITAFRKALDALQPKVIEKGMAFRYNTLQEIYDAYVQAAAQWGYNYNRCALFEDGVLSSVLGYLPENDAERCSQGLYYLQKDPPEPFARSLNLRGTNINFYDSLRGCSPDFSNLSGTCFDIVYGLASAGAASPFARLAHVGKLMSNKNREQTALMQRVGQHQASRAVI